MYWASLPTGGSCGNGFSVDAILLDCDWPAGTSTGPALPARALVLEPGCAIGAAAMAAAVDGSPR